MLCAGESDGGDDGGDGGSTCTGDDLVWGEWGACSEGCHTVNAPIATRTRVATGECTNEESETCNLICAFWQWSTWGSCTGSCGSQTRDRTGTVCSTGTSADCTDPSQEFKIHTLTRLVLLYKI